MVAILLGVNRFLTMVLLCISLMILNIFSCGYLYLYVFQWLSLFVVIYVVIRVVISVCMSFRVRIILFKAKGIFNWIQFLLSVNSFCTVKLYLWGTM